MEIFTKLVDAGGVLLGVLLLFKVWGCEDDTAAGG